MENKTLSQKKNNKSPKQNSGSNQRGWACLAIRPMASLKRGAPAQETASKKARSSVDGINVAATHFLCAITQELPFDPVSAADGHTYERKAITEWLERKKTSPLTNQPMTNVLYPAVGVRNAIEALIDSGAVTAELADAWITQRSWKAELEGLRDNARLNNNTAAMLELYKCYRFGLKNAVKDQDTALQWARRGARHGQRTCSYVVARDILDINIDTSRSAYAISLLTRAAMGGSSKAAGKLARRYGKGDVDGLPQCAAQARYFRSLAAEGEEENESDMDCFSNSSGYSDSSDYWDADDSEDDKEGVEGGEEGTADADESEEDERAETGVSEEEDADGAEESGEEDADESGEESGEENADCDDENEEAGESGDEAEEEEEEEE
jgi:hypothetical protein